MSIDQNHNSLSSGIRPSKEITEALSNDYSFRLHETKRQLQHLANIYYGVDTSYLPYVYKIMKGQAPGNEPFWRNEYYVFDPEAADDFIDHMAEYYKLAYSNIYLLDPSEEHVAFFRTFLYLAIRIACPDQRLRPYLAYYYQAYYGFASMIDEFDELNSGTFQNLLQLARLSRLSFTENTFHQNYEILGKTSILGQDTIGPGLFASIELICRLLGKPGCYIHPASPQEEEAANEAYRKQKEKNLQELAAESGMTVDEFLQMTEEMEDAALKEWTDKGMTEDEYYQMCQEYADATAKDAEAYVNPAYVDKYEASVRDYADSFPDADRFIQAACYYRDHLFDTDNKDIVQECTDAIHLFLTHNGHSLLGDSDSYLDAHAEVSLSVKELETISAAYRTRNGHSAKHSN